MDTSGNPWLITFNLGGGTALPAIVIGPQNTGGTVFGTVKGQAYPFLPKRIVWISPSAVGGDQVILQDVPANGGTARNIARFVATGADFMPPQEWKRGDTEAYFVGLQVKQMDSGELEIYL